MAYDKAVDSAALDAGLTAIANAIREKAGSSDALAFPDAMAAAIAAIESGGLKVEYGTVTAAEDTNTLSISHNLGITPKLYMAMNLLSADTNALSDLRKTLAFYVMSEYFDIDSFRSNKGLVGYANGSEFFTKWNVYGSSYATNSYATATSTYVTIGSPNLNDGFRIRAGNTYFYLIAG